jgi:hypothetical protein
LLASGGVKHVIAQSVPKPRNKQRFVQLFHWLLKSAAWKDLDTVARSIYVELTYRYNGSNNGRIGYSARQAGQDLKISKDTAARGLRSLEAHGFIVVEKRGAFHCKVRHASEYRLTIYDSDVASYMNKLATKEFMRWPEIQNSVPAVRPTVSAIGPIDPSSRTGGHQNHRYGPRGRTGRVD